MLGTNNSVVSAEFDKGIGETQPCNCSHAWSIIDYICTANTTRARGAYATVPEHAAFIHVIL